MNRTSVQGLRPVRFLVTGLTSFVLTVLTLGLLASPAILAHDPPKQPPAKPAETTKQQEPAKPGHDGTTGAVAEVVKLIDDRLSEAWKANKVTPAERCSDYEFIRRATLDIVGRIARPAEVDRFLKDPKDTRRAMLVDRLLNGEDYARNWANIWTTWLLTRSGDFGRGEYHDEMHSWLEDQFAHNRSYKDLVTGLIAPKMEDNAKNKPAGGDIRRIANKDLGAVNFILAHVGELVPGPKQREEGQFEMAPITARTTRLFLGIQTQCTQCHDHPFDSRKQEEFWGINAFFRQVRREGNPRMRRNQGPEVLTLLERSDVNPAGTVFFEKRSGSIREQKAQFFDGKRVPQGARSRLDELAKMLIEHENFTRAFVNRMWGHFFGKGFCNPIDDFNASNNVSHPELLDELGSKFKEYGYDQKQLIRWMCNSRAYNLRSVANATNDKPENDVLFSRMLMKAMSPEQLFESITIATQTETSQTAEAKKALRDRWMRQLITNFGDDEGNEVNFNGTVVQALMLMNGDDINQAIADKQGTVARMLARVGAANYNINHLYLVVLNRPATQEESKKVLAAMPLLKPQYDKREAPWNDLLWALLNSNEFLLNH